MVNSRMFHLVTRTWNPIIGCLHGCVYCWARALVERRLSKISKKYSGGFKPRLHEPSLKESFRPNEFVFVSDMGDAWGWWIPREWILKVLDVVRRFPKTTFLFLTKNPRRYREFGWELASMVNVVVGATVETDDDKLYEKYGISKAPQPRVRLLHMIMLRREFRYMRLMLSIEPILDFTPRFWELILEVAPDFVYVGYDNYGNRLPEPPLHKTLELIDRLREHGIKVFEKTLRKAWYEGRKVGRR